MKRDPNTSGISDELLLAFRQATEIEFRLLELEIWISTTDHPQRWTVCVARLLKLIRKNPGLKCLHDEAHEYLRLIHEGRG
jgi:hypothetical protein